MKKTALLLSASLLAATSAMAAPAADNSALQQSTGLYIGAQWLPGIFLASPNDNNTIGTGYGFSGSQGPSFGLNVGYQFTKNLGVEVGSQGTMVVMPFIGSVGVIFPSVAIKGILPLENNFVLYGKVGPSVGIAEASDAFGKDQGTSAFAIYGDAGAGYYATKTIEINVDQSIYYMPKMRSALGYTGVGLTFHFSS